MTPWPPTPNAPASSRPAQDRRSGTGLRLGVRLYGSLRAGVSGGIDYWIDNVTIGYSDGNGFAAVQPLRSYKPWGAATVELWL